MLSRFVLTSLLLALSTSKLISALTPEIGVTGQLKASKNPLTINQLSKGAGKVARAAQDSATSPIEVYGNKFFVKDTGEQFFMKGIAYQPSRAGDGEVYDQSTSSRFIDPMAETDICLRDLPYLQKLGVNLVRVYSIDTEKDHDKCFQAFADAGIYVIADLSEPDISIVREAPTWDITINRRYQKVVDSLNKYTNLFGFFAGNEVTNDKTNTDASPFVKASIRDIKAYIKEKGYRNIPVGYSTNDDEETRQSLADYFACGDSDQNADFYGVNMYEWCGYSTYWSSGYKDRTEEFKDYPVPVFFSEFGCNIKRPRPFVEVEALYGRLMTDVWSGGIAYMYFEEPNQYGVIKIVNGQVQELDDFNYLREQYNQANPKGITLEEYKKKTLASKIPNCPLNSRYWEASIDVPHTPDAVKCDCLESSLQCKLSPYVRINELSNIFTYACGIVDCTDILGNGTTGEYGVYSDCAVKQKASYVINEVFLKQGGGDPKNCDFNGLAAFNSRASGQKELDSRKTLNGESCFEFLSKQSILKFGQGVKETNATSNDTSFKSVDGSSRSVVSSNHADKLQFYSNLFNTVGLSTIFVILVSIFA